MNFNNYMKNKKYYSMKVKEKKYNLVDSSTSDSGLNLNPQKKNERIEKLKLMMKMNPISDPEPVEQRLSNTIRIKQLYENNDYRYRVGLPQLSPQHCDKTPEQQEQELMKLEKEYRKQYYEQLELKRQLSIQPTVNNQQLINTNSLSEFTLQQTTSSNLVQSYSSTSTSVQQISNLIDLDSNNSDQETVNLLLFINENEQ